MDFTNSTFAHGLQIGQTIALHASNGQALPGNCSDKTSSEKVKLKIGKVMAVAVLLLFALANHVNAQMTTDYLVRYGSTPGTFSTSTNSLIYDNGTDLGIGTSSPGSFLHLYQAHISGAEQCFQIQVDDATNDYFKVNNVTGNSGTFCPNLSGHVESANGYPGLYFIGSCNSSNDFSGNTTPLQTFDARSITSGVGDTIVHRPLFVWSNFGNTRMEMSQTGALGLGTSTPASHLDIVGNAGATNVFSTENYGGTTLFNIQESGDIGLNYLSPVDLLDLGSLATSSTLINAKNYAGSNIFHLQDNGYLGLGTTSPDGRLDIVGTGATSSTYALTIENSTPTPMFDVRNDGYVGINNTSPGAQLDVKGNNNTTSYYALQAENSSGTSLLSVRDDGKVGIGTTLPGAQLEVDASAGTGIYANMSTSTSPAFGISSSTVSSASNPIGVYSITSCSATTGTAIAIESSANGSSADTRGIQSTAYLNSGSNSATRGVAGYSPGNVGTSNAFYGVYGYTDCGVASNTYYGVYGTNTCTTSGIMWAGYFNGAAGCTAGAWTPSDEKLKENIQPLTGALNSLMKMQPKTYNYRINDYPSIHFQDGPQLGLIAEDVEKIYPNLVRQNHQPEERDKNGNVIDSAVDFKMLNYNGLIPVVIAAVQQQQDTITKQQTIIQQQQGQIAAQQAQLTAQQSQLAAQQAQNGQLQSAMSDLQNQFSSVLAEIEQLKTLQAECCGSVGSSSTIGSSNGGNGSSNDLPTLAQNVPNPFTQSTVISYYLPASMPNAVITIRSMTGTTLQSFNITSSGNGQITVSQGTLAPATYEYDMIVNGKLIDSKKMIIVGE